VSRYILGIQDFVSLAVHQRSKLLSGCSLPFHFSAAKIVPSTQKYHFISLSGEKKLSIKKYSNTTIQITFPQK